MTDDRRDARTEPGALLARIDEEQRRARRGIAGIAASRIWARYAAALAASAITTLVAIPLHRAFELSNIVMLYLLAVVPVAMKLGRGPAILVAIVNVLAFDWFFVAPQYTFAVADVQYLFTFIVMLIVGLVIGQLTARLRSRWRVSFPPHRPRNRLPRLGSDLSRARCVARRRY